MLEEILHFFLFNSFNSRQITLRISTKKLILKKVYNFIRRKRNLQKRNNPETIKVNKTFDSQKQLRNQSKQSIKNDHNLSYLVVFQTVSTKPKSEPYCNLIQDQKPLNGTTAPICFLPSSHIASKIQKKRLKAKNI